MAHIKYLGQSRILSQIDGAANLDAGRALCRPKRHHPQRAIPAKIPHIDPAKAVRNSKLRPSDVLNERLNVIVKVCPAVERRNLGLGALRRREAEGTGARE